MLRQGERRQNERQQHRRNLRANHHMLAVDAIGDNAADRRDQEDGNLAGKAHCPQLQSRSRQPVDQPRLGDGLHPGADQRDQLSAEKELEVAMAQGAPAACQRSFRLPRFPAPVRRYAALSGMEIFDSATFRSL